MIGGVDKTGGGKVEKWQVTFNLTPENAILIVKNLKGQIMQPIQNNIYELETGVYTYTASAEGYPNIENKRIEIYKDDEIDVNFQNEFSFSTATDTQLERMLNAHYNGELNISDYWHVGDTRKIHINEIIGKRSSEKYVEQDITIVIIGFDHDDLVTKAGERTKAAVTVQFRECFGCDGDSANGDGTYEFGPYYDTSPNYYDKATNYKDNPRRAWFNETVLNAMPEIFIKLIKTVRKKNLKNHDREIANATVSNSSDDKIFLLSVPEVTNENTVGSYLYGNPIGNYEGSLYEYYKTSKNRIKYYNNNGEKGNTTNWWLRSPSTEFTLYQNYYNNYYFMSVTSAGKFIDIHGSEGICPAFCV